MHRIRNAKIVATLGPASTDRVAKYNCLLLIEAELGNDAIYRGRSVFPSRA